MDTVRFENICDALGFVHPMEDNNQRAHERLPLQSFLALIDAMDDRGFNLASIELVFHPQGSSSDKDFTDQIAFDYDPEDDTCRATLDKWMS